MKWVRVITDAIVLVFPKISIYERPGAIQNIKISFATFYSMVKKDGCYVVKISGNSLLSPLPSDECLYSSLP